MNRTLIGSMLLGASAVAAGSGDLASLGDLSIEQLMELSVQKVYGASRFEQKVTRAPASVTIVTRDEIRKYGHRTLAEALRSVRGLYVTYDRNYSNFGIRGFNRPGDFNTRVLLLVDGHRMNDNLYQSALIGAEAAIDIDLVERIEVIRGPSSSIYGSNAFFGVINVVTRKGEEIDGVEAVAEAGSRQTYKGRLTYGRQFGNGVETASSVSLHDSQGNRSLYYPEFDSPGNNNGVAADADGERAQNYYASVGYRGVTLSTAYARRDKHVPTASFGTVFNDGRERTTDERLLVDLRYEHEFSDDFRGLARAYYDRYAYRADYPYDFAGPGDPPFLVVTHDDNYGDGVGAELQLTRHLTEKHKAVFGGELRRDLNLRQSNYTDDPRTYSFDSSRDAQSAGLFVQDEYTAMTNVLVSAGLRFDHYSGFGSALSPRLGVIYSPFTHTTLKLLAGQAYRAPNAFELYLESPGYNKANPDLQPEKIRTYELVLEQYLDEHLRFDVSTYHYDIRDLITQQADPSDGALVFRNENRIGANGLEVELAGRYERAPSFVASYALQRATDDRSGKGISNSPRHLAKLNMTLPLWTDRLHAGLELQYTSRLETISGNRSGGFVVVNATLLGTRLVGNLDASLSVYNLLDKSYAFPGSTGHFQDSIPQDGRTFRLTTTYRF